MISKPQQRPRADGEGARDDAKKGIVGEVSPGKKGASLHGQPWFHAVKRAGDAEEGRRLKPKTRDLDLAPNSGD